MSSSEQKSNEEGTSTTGTAAYAAQALQLLFQRHRVPDRQRSKTIQEVLELSYPAAHRRMTGEIECTLDELERIATRFGEGLADLFVALKEGQSLEATFEAGTFKAPCRVWLGAPTNPLAPTTLVAWNNSDRGWLVAPSGDAPPDSMAVREMTMQSNTQRRVQVAVLDDDPDYAQSLAATLSQLGLRADPFVTSESLLKAARDRRYDAYVVDWLLDHTSAEATCRSLRDMDDAAVLILLTGKLATAEVDEGAMLRIANSLSMEAEEKPVRPSFLAAKIQRQLAARVA